MEPKQEDSEKIFQKRTNVEGSSYKFQVASFKSQVSSLRRSRKTANEGILPSPNGAMEYSPGRNPRRGCSPG